MSEPGGKIWLFYVGQIPPWQSLQILSIFAAISPPARISPTTVLLKPLVVFRHEMMVINVCR